MSLDSISQLSWLGLFALGSAALAASIIVWYLVRKPELVRATKIALLFGIGVFPISAAFTGNLAGYQKTMEREFCGSCHSMEPYVVDSNDLNSNTLPSIHGRNELFGKQNCYTCHSDYGMFGTVSTKLSGMRHVWEYYTEYRSVPIEEFLVRVKLYEPYPNSNCTYCHSTVTPGWNGVPEHVSGDQLITNGELSCMSAGCHGPAHPFSKQAKQDATHE